MPVPHPADPVEPLTPAGVAGAPGPPAPPPRPPSPGPPAVSRLWWFAGPVLAVLLVALVWVAAAPVPYFTISPGSARSVEPLVTITGKDGEPRPHTEGADDNLLFLTVSVRRPAGIEALYKLRDDTVEVVPEKVITGGQSRAENTRFNLQLMTDSKDKAAKVALERAGYEVPVTSTGAVVTDLDPSYPVAKVVSPGDTIVEADDTAIASAEDLVAVIGRHQPGDRITLALEPLGSDERRSVTTKLAARPDDATKPLLGVTLEDRPRFEFPLDVEIDSGKVGGPSAGLAFTLAILDRLTPGDLTGGKVVAVTGTIVLDGTVGPVGGVAQKTEAAVRAGARMFLVPPDEYAVARRIAGGRLQVRKAATLDDALEALQDLGGDPVPAAASTTSGAPQGD